MPKKVNTARVILKVLGWIQIVVGVILFLFFLFGSFLIGTSGQEGAGIGSLITGTMGLILMVIVIGLGIVYLITAKGISEKKNWAKTVGIILGVLSLPNVPLGTILGIFILLGLMGEEADSWFGK